MASSAAVLGAARAGEGAWAARVAMTVPASTSRREGSRTPEDGEGKCVQQHSRRAGPAETR